MPKRIIGWLITLLTLLTISINGVAQSGFRIVVVNEQLNVRVSPAIGSAVISTVEAGYVFENVTARSGDNQWVRVEYQCAEGWINLTPVVLLQGDIATLPVADPRSIPYGGFDSPRAGFTQQLGTVTATATDGLRVRYGPSRAYPQISNINFNQVFSVTGRNACGSWYQVNFDGTLGWVASDFVQITNGDVNSLPVGGIVAESVPPSGETAEDYFATLRFMRDRLIIAQESLDRIRASWTDAALNGRATCQAYPARPSDFTIPVPLLAAYYQTLNPLITDFNDAMFNVRQAIDLFIEVCNQAGTANPVGQATVQGALNIVNLADQQFASLLPRIVALIPSEEVGPNECRLIYNAKSEILPVINLNTVYLDEFTRRTYARGYCFYGIEGQTLNLQTLPIPDAQLEIFISVSALDTPADFVTVSRGRGGSLQSVGPVLLPRTATYLLIVADLGSEGRSPIGQYAFRINDVSFGRTFPTLQYDTATNSIVLQEVSTQPTTSTTQQAVTTVCPSTAFTCTQLFTCDEARACYQAGNFSLDGDGDGIPCEETLCLP